MSEADDISGLEAALAERARKLVEEHLANGRLQRDRILAETRERLQLDKERALASAKAHAERAYQQRVQAAELELRAELDRLRSELINAALAQIPALLSALTADEARYLPLLLNQLHDAALAIERDELVVQLNGPDAQRLQPEWERYARDTARGKQLTLSPEALSCVGGAMVISADGYIRIDNTFEGRMERLDETLQGVIAEQLMPQFGATGNG
ncbi:MAG TPA: V-type ATP synthase subunit E family protein [Gallionella sp.]|nr:V-type ATP synthase subunit E family protein [Gallionella sp.]